ncbi:hypothetical protein ABIB25_004738 [Nakamurella sp. UYEF19]|uniref:hypothetical protein n=1 Tax=Nakamurella sp. UYEF19 TaxID=1756392 RepID=UPI003399B324
MTPPRLTAGLLIAATALCLVACSSTSAPTTGLGAPSLPAVVVSAIAAQSAAGPASEADTSTAPDTGPARPAIDPCRALTKADLQPFFTVPVATSLPSPIKSDSTLGCEWAAADGGGLSTSMDMLVVVGQDGQDRWNLATETGHPELISGIGDHAGHLAGNPDMFAIKGTGAHAVWCGVTSLGWKELAGKKDLPDVQNIPDSAASAIAAQYGLLCNRIFGSGNTSPTMTAPLPTGSAAVVTASGPTVAPAAVGGVMPGTDVPLPRGADCSGSHTAKDTVGNLVCTTTDTEPDAAYNFFLLALPKAGYAVNHQSYEKGADGKALAGLGFSGGKFSGFDFVNIRGINLSVTVALG